MRRIKVLKTVGFWSSLSLFLIPTLMTVFKLDWQWAVKLGLFIPWTGLFVLSQFLKAFELSREQAKAQTETRLRCVETLKMLNPDQTLRANVFLWDRKKKCYYIWHHHGMDTDLAKSFTEIPRSQGCTGAAWEGEKQIWGNEADIFGKGQYALPKDQEEKVNRDLKWICSTPVRNARRKVIAVLNFDGNKPMDMTECAFVRAHATRVAGELSEILSNAPLP
jgi:hypothetical protein